jgi:hypothetical protein
MVKMDDHGAVVKFTMGRFGFNYYSAADEFLKTKSLIEDPVDRAVAISNGADPVKSFTRVTQIDPKNPYGYAYLLFAMEDAGTYTIDQLLAVADGWHTAAVEYKHQGQNAFAMMYFNRYM